MKSVAKAGFSCFLLSAAVLGQSSTAQISGAVKDQTGALLPGAEITATQTDTGVARSTVSNESSPIARAVKQSWTRKGRRRGRKCLAQSLSLSFDPWSALVRSVDIGMDSLAAHRSML